jgi:hypothetical protein
VFSPGNIEGCGAGEFELDQTGRCAAAWLDCWPRRAAISGNKFDLWPACFSHRDSRQTRPGYKLLREFAERDRHYAGVSVASRRDRDRYWAERFPVETQLHACPRDNRAPRRCWQRDDRGENAC